MKKNLVTETFKDTQKRAKNFLSAKRIAICIFCFLITAFIVLLHALKILDPLAEKNIYIIRLIDSVAWITGGIFVNKIFDFILVITLRGSKRAITIEIMLHSCVKYIVGIAIIVALLIVWLGKAYVSEVLGGLGILALIIGFGAQKLISDIIAGFFMVFEAHIAVGDVITIGDFRGVVQEIGLRTTVLVNDGGNIKIMNNSSISEFINMSRNVSYASCACLLDYDEDLERAENIIIAALPSIKEKIPTALSEPEYKGVDALSDSGYKLKIVAKCEEENIFQTQRALNRELLLLCKKENIRLAFPQLEIRNK